MYFFWKFLLGFRIFYIENLWHLWTESVLIFSFPTWMFYVSFSCVFALAKTSGIMLNRNSMSGDSHLVPDLGGKSFNFWQLSMILGIVSFKDKCSFTVWTISILFPNCWGFLSEINVLCFSLLLQPCSHSGFYLCWDQGKSEKINCQLTINSVVLWILVLFSTLPRAIGSLKF